MYGQNKQSLVFGIDLDDTISADKELFREIIGAIQRRGHAVWIVTARNDGDYCDILAEFENIVDKVVFSAQQAKQDVVDVDIWIDDFPLAITHKFEGAKFIAGDKAKKWL